MSAFDFECRREIRMKDGLRGLSKLLVRRTPRVYTDQTSLALIHHEQGSDNPKVQEQAMIALANCALDVPCKQVRNSMILLLPRL